ncbi:hypothetical protein KCP69_03170 [Salmonella enterica subsp. enterica]|nr:hypothetical protein KCP69_03170 [Salmonella enterica subsp. enterica]
MIGNDETTKHKKSLPSRICAVYRRDGYDPSGPWDISPQRHSSVRSRVEKSEEETKMTNAVIPPAKMPPP